MMNICKVLVSCDQSDKATTLTSILFWMDAFLYQESELSGLWPSHICSIYIAYSDSYSKILVT